MDRLHLVGPGAEVRAKIRVRNESDAVALDDYPAAKIRVEIQARSLRPCELSADYFTRDARRLLDSPLRPDFVDERRAQLHPQSWKPR